MSPHVNIDLEHIFAFFDFSSEVSIFSLDFLDFFSISPDFSRISREFTTFHDGYWSFFICFRDFSNIFLVFFDFSSRIPDFSSRNPGFTPNSVQILREFPTFRDGFRDFLISHRDSSPVFLISLRIPSISPIFSPNEMEKSEVDFFIEGIFGDHLRENFREISSDDSIFRFLIRCAIPDPRVNFVEVALAGEGHSEVPPRFVAKFDISCDGSNFGERKRCFHVLSEFFFFGKFWFATNVTNCNFFFDIYSDLISSIVIFIWSVEICFLPICPIVDFIWSDANCFLPISSIVEFIWSDANCFLPISSIVDFIWSDDFDFLG
jgi:hypothetical protein